MIYFIPKLITIILIQFITILALTYIILNLTAMAQRYHHGQEMRDIKKISKQMHNPISDFATLPDEFYKANDRILEELYKANSDRIHEDCEKYEKENMPSNRELITEKLMSIYSLLEHQYPKDSRELITKKLKPIYLLLEQGDVNLTFAKDGMTLFDDICDLTEMLLEQNNTATDLNIIKILDLIIVILLPVDNN